MLNLRGQRHSFFFPSTLIFSVVRPMNTSHPPSPLRKVEVKTMATRPKNTSNFRTVYLCMTLFHLVKAEGLGMLGWECNCACVTVHPVVNKWVYCTYCNPRAKTRDDTSCIPHRISLAKAIHWSKSTGIELWEDRDEFRTGGKVGGGGGGGEGQKKKVKKVKKRPIIKIFVWKTKIF